MILCLNYEMCRSFFEEVVKISTLNICLIFLIFKRLTFLKFSYFINFYFESLFYSCSLFPSNFQCYITVTRCQFFYVVRLIDMIDWTNNAVMILRGQMSHSERNVQPGREQNSRRYFYSDFVRSMKTLSYLRRF